MRRILLLVLAVLLLTTVPIGLMAATAPASVGTWSSIGSLSDARTGAAAALLADGRVLVTGGVDASNTILGTTEFVNPDGTVTQGPTMNLARSGHTATVVSGTQVLVIGGQTAAGATNTAELFDAATNSWTSLGATLGDARSGHAALAMPDGTIIIVGGSNSGLPVMSVETFAANQFAYLGTLSTSRSNAAVAALSDGRLLVAGGSDVSGTALQTTEIFDPSLGGSTSGPTLSVPRSAATASTLLDGTVAIIGGSYAENADIATIEVIDAVQGTDKVLPTALATARSGQIAQVLPDNNAVLIIGGTNAGNSLSSAELFQPWNNTVTATTMASLHQGGAVAAGSGILTLAGGSNGTTVEQYGYATLKSDKPDYHPTEPVTVIGSGWQPNETVTLTMVETPPVDGNITYSVIADGDGNFSNPDFYAPTPLDVGALYVMTASGSKSQAQIRFTDQQNNALGCYDRKSQPGLRWAKRSALCDGEQ
jgi:hypothetical protein